MEVSRSRRSEWQRDDRDGFVGVEGRVVIGRSDLTVSMLRFAPKVGFPCILRAKMST